MIRKKILFLIPFLTIPVLFLLGLQIYNFFQLKKVFVISKKVMINGLDLLDNQNLLLINKATFEKLLLEKNAVLKNIKIEKKWPDSLIILLTIRNPSAILVSGNHKLYIDDEQVVLSNSDSITDNLPAFEIKNIPLIINKKADWRIMKTYEILDSVTKKGISVSKIIIDGQYSYIKMILSEGTNVFIPLVSEPYRIAASLQIIMSRFRIEGKIISQIDFQFEKPVIIFGSGEKNYSSLEL